MLLDAQLAHRTTNRTVNSGLPSSIGKRRRAAVLACAGALGLILLVPLRDSRVFDGPGAYQQARTLFERGYLEQSQQQAAAGYRELLSTRPELARKFLLLDAESMVWRGMNPDALRLLSIQPPGSFTPEESVQKLTLEGVAHTRLQEFPAAAASLQQAESLCASATYATCGGVFRAQGIWALEQGDVASSRDFFLKSLAFSRTHHDRMLEATVLLNMGAASLQNERYDEALDWSTKAYRLATATGAEDLAQVASGNLGWAYFKLGDRERALDLLLEAEKRAARLGDVLFEIKWLTTTAYVHMDSGDAAQARQAYQRALESARRIHSREDIASILIDLAQVSISTGNADDAESYGREAQALAQESGNRADQADILAIQLQAAALRADRSRAEQLMHQIEAAPESQTAMKWASEHALAKLYEQQGDASAALEAYTSALKTVEDARAEIQNEDSRLPFLSNATRIYDDYIHFLVNQGRTDEALVAADQSRARTLAQGLGLPVNQPSLMPAALRAGQIPRKTGATILFYWLGEKESYLWAMTARQTTLFHLPPQRNIVPLVVRYRKELLEPDLASDAAIADGMALYRMMVEPAAGLIAPGGNVVVVCDGPLSLLNFETLVAPATSGGAPHFWIEDANVVSAPSLYMLAAARPATAGHRHLLLMGDAKSPNSDYPELPMARAEMQKIEKHFAPAEETVFAGQSANAMAYVTSPLRDFAYIHFVAHGVASRIDPLDSAIILSPTGTAEDSFKLHARDIIQHPLDARLVTISACYGGGTRSYAGEGLVGLSWAFLRAGAHNVIGALWEASDDSTPLLMDNLYAGLADGMSPSTALRQAKLALLHSQGKFSQPFYWAPFQLYAGM
jgi:CHAT domain-containing protein